MFKINGFAKNLGSLDTGELTYCEACHLSWAQFKLCHEQSPIPFEHLDEVFVDIVGPMELILLNISYVTIIADATTRMR